VTRYAERLQVSQARTASAFYDGHDVVDFPQDEAVQPIAVVAFLEEFVVEKYLLILRGSLEVMPELQRVPTTGSTHAAVALPDLPALIHRVVREAEFVQRPLAAPF